MLKTIIREVAASRGAEVFDLEVMPDQVHLQVGVDPRFGVHRLVKSMKSRSSRALRREFEHCRAGLPALWTNKYFVCTSGRSSAHAVKRYIEDQNGEPRRRRDARRSAPGQAARTQHAHSHFKTQSHTPQDRELVS